MLNRNAMVAAMALATMPSGMAATYGPVHEVKATPRPARKVRRASEQAPLRFRRSKGTQAKPKRRPNRMHVSKRVRRKHRRA